MKTNDYKKNYRKINEGNNKVIWVILTLLLLGLAVARYFYHLDARVAFDVDESQTFSTAVGYLKTGTLYKWDFWNDRISAENYGENMSPFLILLGLWMKVFGISLVSARSLSATLGCLFILSVIYIIKKLFGRMDIVIITVAFVLVNTDITYLFRFIRMYALVMLLSIWFIYFAFMALTTGNNFKGNNKFSRLIKRNFDFNLFYTILAIVICYLSAKIHNIQMVMCGGMALFVLYKAVSCKERKYKNLALLGIICVLLGTIGILYKPIWDFLPVIYYFAGSLQYWIDFGAYNNTMYFWDQIYAVSNQILMLLGWGTAVVSLFIKNVKKKDQLVYLLLIQIISIVFFVWFANHYYQARYLCFLFPISILIFTVGFVKILGENWKKDIILLVLAGIIIVKYYHNGFNYLYTPWNAPISQKVYEKVDDLLDGEKIDILAVDFDMELFGYFASQQLDNVNYDRWDNYDAEYPFMDVYNFAEKHPRGLVWIQSNQIFNRSINQKKFLQKWTDRVAGEGLDNYNIEIGRLNYIKPQNREKMEDVSLENFTTIEQEPGTDKYKLKLYGNILDNETRFVCIKLLVEDEIGNVREERYQLGIPQTADRKNYCYIYDISLETTDKVMVSNDYAVIDGEELTEHRYEIQ